ncbi:MAG: exonuclease domain-containing protein [Alistipes putredinis]|uniref:exonuclease domain-containing protein n=1 Tax=Alistipes putredinis TaxID=28117 RepID=UPI00399EEC5A
MRKLLQQFKKIVFFDTETTGLDPEKDQIIELAAALVTENGIELKIDAFCKLPEGEKDTREDRRADSYHRRHAGR